MSLSTTELVGLITAIGGLLVAVNSVIKSRVDNKGSVVSHFKTLVDTYLAEITRLTEEAHEKEQDYLEDLARLKEAHAAEILAARADRETLKLQHQQEIEALKQQHKRDMDKLTATIDELRETTIKQAQKLARYNGGS